MDAEILRIGRDRLSRVFRFLEALNQHRNPAKRQIREQLWVLWFRDLPDHPSIRRGSLRLPSSTTNKPDEADEPRREQDGADFVLKVRRPALTRPPNPPEVIGSWLERGWEDPFKEVSVRETRNDVGKQGETLITRFEDAPQRVEALQEWKSRRDKWVRNERPARAAMKVFEELYELYGRVEREAEKVELIAGDGVLSWRRVDGGVYHPILLQRLQVEFNPSVPEFTLLETEHPVELYSALFHSMPDVDGRAMARCREELEEGSYHPLGDDSTSGFLRRLVVQLSSRGEFLDQGAPQGETDYPRIGRDPVLFLRARTLGFATAIEAVLEDLRSREDLPWPLLNIVGVEPPPSSEAHGPEPSDSAWGDPEDILLSKPANPEQARIARQLESHGGVLVQGPPGTGKTHTIGNLIGYLQAQGKSVLVTSHTTKALRMVREHVVPRLRPLCVSVLESDLESRKQLESAVGAIAERLSRADARQLEEEAERLETQRKELIKKLRQLRRQLLDARADEYRDVVVGGKSWSPSEAARKVAREGGQHDWVPGPTTAGVVLPLSEGELVELYRTNSAVTPEDEVELSSDLPPTSDLLKPDEFEQLIRERSRLGSEDLGFRTDLWDAAPDQGSPEDLETLARRLQEAIEPLSGKEVWRLAVISAGKNGGPHREPWEQLLSMIGLVHREGVRVEEALLRYGPRLCDQMSLEEQGRAAEEILSHLEVGGRLSFFSFLARPSWKKFVQRARVASGQPRLAEHFHALRKLVRLKALRQELAGRWDRQVAPRGAPASKELGEEIEKTLIQYCAAIRDCLDWHTNVWTPLEKDLRTLGFRWEKFLIEQPVVAGPNGELIRLHRAVANLLPGILNARANALRWSRNDKQLGDLRARLDVACGDSTSSRVITRLRDALSQLDQDGYREGFERLTELHQRRSDLERRQRLLARLEVVAPAWATAIRDRQGSHGNRDIPGDSMAAWLWRQLHDELERRSRISLEELLREIEKLKEQLRHVTVELIDRRAWASQAKRTSLRQRQALIGWLDTVRKIGKGYGIRVSRLRAEAARKMSECRGAVPVWVMPLSRAVENFDPRSARFDVVIIDEASQSDVMALVALYLGHKVVVLGDHEQVSPSAVGQDLSVVQHLIDEHLQGIPNDQLYDGQTSVYDLARQSFGGTICLLEHFRCVPEIIQFSNHLSYDGQIKPLRDPSHVRLKPHVVAHRVRASGREGKVNPEEAITIASLIAAAIEQPEYRHNQKGDATSFGVVSLLGEEQALEIDGLLRSHLSPEQYERHRSLCGTAAQFQGDERDVVFVSMVDTAEGGPLPLRDQQMFKQRFNVAASRARDQLWVVHSLNPQTDLKPGDLRRRLIEHVLNPKNLLRLLEDKEKRTQSEFERLVMRRLITAGFRVTPQWMVGAYRIDLVVEGDGKRLAVECDGDRYHPLEKLSEDMERQAILERLGWIFVRIRGSEFFRDPDRAMEPVFAKLAALEIPPSGDKPDTHEQREPQTELIDRVIRNAEAVRKQWKDQEFTFSDETGSVAPPDRRFHSATLS